LADLNEEYQDNLQSAELRKDEDIKKLIDKINSENEVFFFNLCAFILNFYFLNRKN
jgi:hypothetical protein